MVLLLVLSQACAGHIPTDPYLFDGPTTCAPLKSVLVTFLLTSM